MTRSRISLDWWVVIVAAAMAALVRLDVLRLGGLVIVVLEIIVAISIMVLFARIFGLGEKQLTVAAATFGMVIAADHWIGF